MDSRALVAGTTATAIAVAAAAALGASPARAVLGGTVARAGEPGVAFVDAILPSGATAGCTGTVVAPRLVLTAGHCVHSRATGRRLDADELLVTTGDRRLSGAQTAVVRIDLDPRFDAATLRGDAALLELATPTRQTPVRLPRGGPAVPGPLGSPATLAGFGATVPGQPTPARQLRSAPTVIEPDATCTASWGTQFDAADDLCAGAPAGAAPTGACNGDSGGPLMSGGVEVGLASYTAAGCATDVPTVFQRTDVLAGWIASVRRRLATRFALRLSLTRGSSAAGRRRSGR